MNIKTNQKTCAYPPCDKPLDGRSNKIYCCERCRYSHHNQKKKALYEAEYKEKEVELRHNVTVLKKLLVHPGYQDNRIETHYLKHEGFYFGACTQPTTAQQEKYPDQDILWSHHYGIEVVDAYLIAGTLHQWITIHHNPKNQ